ncbi:MAG: hypothetical protein KJ070_15290 [Verrucomicrobia bacterium]|nr:hypothetical protein [Verrucomicrobiota bacterium]
MKTPVQTRKFLERSRDIAKAKDSDRYSVFRARDNDDEWRTSLPNTIAEEITRELAGTNLEVFLEA